MWVLHTDFCWMLKKKPNLFCMNWERRSWSKGTERATKSFVSHNSSLLGPKTVSRMFRAIGVIEKPISHYSDCYSWGWCSIERTLICGKNLIYVDYIMRSTNETNLGEYTLKYSQKLSKVVLISMVRSILSSLFLYLEHSRQRPPITLVFNWSLVSCSQMPSSYSFCSFPQFPKLDLIIDYGSCW